jgi:hypothetical protein
MSDHTFVAEGQEFDDFDAPDAVNPDTPTSPNFYMNDQTVSKALHAPSGSSWSASTKVRWNSQDHGGDSSPEPMTFLSDLATNASAKGVQFVFFVGNDDAISPAFGTLGRLPSFVQETVKLIHVHSVHPKHHLRWHTRLYSTSFNTMVCGRRLLRGNRPF